MRDIYGKAGPDHVLEFPEIEHWAEQVDSWLFAHEDYDGPEDSRCGSDKTLEAAKASIDWIEDDCKAALSGGNT